MRQFRLVIDSLNQSQIQGISPCIIEQDNFHHLITVSRVQKGDTIQLIDKLHSKTYLAEVVEIKSQEASLIIKKNFSSQIPFFFPRITLIVGLIRSNRCDLIIEKSVEIGISRINFFCGDHSQMKRNISQLNKREERFGRIIESALKQSGLGCEVNNENFLSEYPEAKVFPSLDSCLESVNNYSPILDSYRNSAKLLFVLEIGAKVNILTKVVNLIDNLQVDLEKFPEIADCYLVVGPEGGFSSSEKQILAKYGYEKVSLGSKTLRTETAVLLASGLIAIQFS